MPVVARAKPQREMVRWISSSRRGGRWHVDPWDEDNGLVFGRRSAKRQIHHFDIGSRDGRLEGVFGVVNGILGREKRDLDPERAGTGGEREWVFRSQKVKPLPVGNRLEHESQLAEASRDRPRR